jgi:hypothetical protein
VRYVLEAGVRKAGNRVRITAHILDSENGAHLWADRFDGVLEDVFDLQDQITDKVVAIVEPSLQRSEIERSRRKRPENLDAYDLYLRAVPYTASQMPEDARIAMEYLENGRSLTLADLCGLGESVFDATPDMARYSYTVSARPRHVGNLMMPGFAANCGDGFAESENRFWIPRGDPWLECSRLCEIVRPKCDDRE